MDDAKFRVIEYKMRQAKAQEQIVSKVRGLIPTLKDHGLPTVAKDFEAVLFELDATEQEMVEWAKNKFADFLKATVDDKGRP